MTFGEVREGSKGRNGREMVRWIQKIILIVTVMHHRYSRDDALGEGISPIIVFYDHMVGLERVFSSC